MGNYWREEGVVDWGEKEDHGIWMDWIWISFYGIVCLVIDANRSG